MSNFKTNPNPNPIVLSKTPLFSEQKRTYWEATSQGRGCGHRRPIHTIQANVAYYNRRKNRRHSKRDHASKRGVWVGYMLYHSHLISRVGQKTAHDFLCNNFAYSQPIIIIFGLYKPQEICNWKVYSPPTTIYVTTLPCEILIATLFMFTYVKQSTYYFGGNNCQFLSKFHEYNF